jgi:hypothetical protein
MSIIFQIKKKIIVKVIREYEGWKFSLNIIEIVEINW